MGGEERRILLKDGLEIERRLRVKGPKGSVERLFRGAVLVEESRTGPGGELLEELFYEEAGADEAAPPGTRARARLREKRSYAYAAGRLARVEASDGEGSSLGSLEYRYDARGRLLELRATGSFGAERSGMLPSPAGGDGGGLGLEWSERGGELAIRRYDAEGRTLLTELRRGGALLRRETFSYAPGSRSPRSSLAEELETRERVETSYGSRGEILAIRRTKEGVEVSRTEFGYDPKGRLLFEQTWRGASLARRTLEYDEAGEPRREERWKDGALVAVALLEASGLRVEELYDGGQLVLRVYYEGGRKVKEEFIEGGLVRRVREYR